MKDFIQSCTSMAELIGMLEYEIEAYHNTAASDSQAREEYSATISEIFQRMRMIEAERKVKQVTIEYCGSPCRYIKGHTGDCEDMYGQPFKWTFAVPD